MFAIIRTGGKQYKVTKGALVFVEKLSEEMGADITFDKVLMLDTGTGLKLGTPFVAGATVIAHVQDQMRTRKVLVFKKKRRHQYRRKKGHRQHQTVLRVLDIQINGKSIFPEGAAPKPSPRAANSSTKTAPAKTAVKVAPKSSTSVAKESKPKTTVEKSSAKADSTKKAAAAKPAKASATKSTAKKAPAKAETSKKK